MKLGLLMLLSAVACSSHPSEVESEVVEAIAGGSPDRSHDAVVAIDIGGEALCTGALVAPDVVLTARHCVSYTVENVDCARNGGPIQGDRDPRTLSIFAGEQAQTLVAKGKRLILPSSNKLCGADAAAIVLDRRVTGVKPLAIGAPAIGSYVTVIGYGRQGSGGAVGVRMKRRSRIVALAKTELEVGEVTCPGDSGGPALDVNGTIVGIVSRGSVPCDGHGAMNVFSRADAHEDLLKGS
jgi:V8-like Glu-specific endopeptidase